MTSDRPSWDVFFLGLAEYYSTRSKDPSTKVGAVIVRPDDNSVAGMGYNGFPRGMPDDINNYLNREEKYERVVHAEVNALSNCRDATMYGYTMYTTFLMCHRCLVQVANKGITRFISPQPTPEQLTRWGKSFERTLRYAREMRVEIDQIHYENQYRK